jgi:hypothetical protein
MPTFRARTSDEAGGSLPPACRRWNTPFMAARTRWLAVALILVLRLAPAQEALRNSMAGAAAAEARRIRPESLPYTFKAGEFRALVTPSLGLDWNDNVRTSKTDREDDFILRPLLNLSASYPVTQRNLLQLNLGVGYQHYFQHDELSTWYLHSGSELSFDIFVDDFLINLHDRFSYSQDSAAEAAVANTGGYADINNTVGVLGTWDLQDVVLSLGYDHANVFSPGAEFGSQARSSELFVARAGLRIHPKLTTGIEATAAFTTYDDEILNDNTSYSAGVYADWQLSPSFRVQPRAGYTIYQFQSTSEMPVPGISTTNLPVRTDDLNSWYANLTVSHQLTDVISYSLGAGREVRLGILSDAIAGWYVRHSIDWKIIKNLSMQTLFNYEHGDSGEGNIQGNLTETFDQWGGGLNLSYPVTDRFTLGLNYRLTVRTSTAASREYTQNLVSLLLTYRPQ